MKFVATGHLMTKSVEYNMKGLKERVDYFLLLFGETSTFKNSIQSKTNLGLTVWLYSHNETSP